MMVLLVATLNMAAQEEEVMMRGRIENVTDYSMPSLAREGLRKVSAIDQHGVTQSACDSGAVS